MSFERELGKNISKMPIELPCPECGKKLRKRLSEFQRGVKCPGCGLVVYAGSK